MANTRFFEKDPFSPIQYVYPLSQRLLSVKGRFQKIEVLESPYFGKMLALDGVVQFTERDEFFYHEMLAHVALHAHPSPSKVLIIGGGDGGALKEVLKHSVVREATLVEIDSEVTEVSRSFFPDFAWAFEDPRTRVVMTDGSSFLTQHGGSYDVIIVDSTDPTGFAQSLFTDSFFASVASALAGKGIFVAQTESLHFHLAFIREVQTRLAARFRWVDLFTQSLATYAGNWWSFSIASDAYDPRQLRRTVEVPTRYYCEEVHRHCFLPVGLRQKLMSGDLAW